MAAQRLPLCAVSPSGKHSASVIFLHGSGDTGPGLRAWVRDLVPDWAFPHIRVLFPTAPQRPYTPMRGALSNVWFDRVKICRDCEEHLDSIDSMAQTLGGVVQEEVSAGVPERRIILGGFSMGGAMALHLALRFHPEVAGVFALSSFLNKDSVAFQAVEQRCGLRLSVPDLFQVHGTRDQLVLHQWGLDTNAQLRTAGMRTTFHSVPDLYHQLSRAELELLRLWLLERLPPDPDTDP